MAKKDPKWPITSHYIPPEVQDVGLNVLWVGPWMSHAWPTIHPCARSKRETCGMAHREPVTSSVLARHLAACPQPRFELINSQGFLSFPPFPTVKAKILNIEGYSSSKTIMDDQRRSGMIMGNEIIGMCLH